ncbi:hypothetical protein HDU67_007286 [Dinochytrium kinnereticum]|nr:hypothetical protein HDU67_007286 [Dinochytrium kinnereticum]
MGNICLQPYNDHLADAHGEDEEIENMQDPGEMLYLRQSLSMSMSAQQRTRAMFSDPRGPGGYEDVSSSSELESFAPHPIRPMSSQSTLRNSLPSSSSTVSGSGLFFATLMSAVPGSVGTSRRSSGESSPTLRASSISFQRSLFLSTGEKGPLILPRTSSLTTLVLDMQSVVDAILRHLPYEEVQKFSRVSRLWRAAAGPILSKQTVVLTLGWDWGGREWSAAAFPVMEYVLDDFPSCPVVKGNASLEFDSEEEEEEEFDQVGFFGANSKAAAASLPPIKASTCITVYRPVTFNMEDSAPEPFPATATEINQIRITPLTAASPRIFNIHRGDPGDFPSVTSSSPASSRRPNDDTATSLMMPAFTDSLDGLVDMKNAVGPSSVTSTEPAERCIRGRLPARDYGAFSDAIFGKGFGLVLNPSRSGFETLSVVSREWKEVQTEVLPGFGVGDREKEGKEVEEVELCSAARLGQLRRYVKEIGGAQTVLDAVVNSVAMKRYLSCPEEDRVWAFRHVIETLLEPSDPERGHHELNDTINRLDKIAHRVEILSQVGIPGSQRLDRLRSYYAEGCRAWRSIIGGDIALRVGGYHGSLSNDDAVYKFLSAELLPAFTL